MTERQYEEVPDDLGPEPGEVTDLEHGFPGPKDELPENDKDNDDDLADDEDDDDEYDDPDEGGDDAA